MLGDLSYDSTFANQDFQIIYRIESNILFVVFVTSIAGFIIYILTNISTEDIEKRLKQSECHLANLSLRSQLYYDEVLASTFGIYKPLEMWVRRSNTISTQSFPRYTESRPNENSDLKATVIYDDKIINLYMKDDKHKEDFRNLINECEIGMKPK